MNETFTKKCVLNYVVKIDIKVFKARKQKIIINIEYKFKKKSNFKNRISNTIEKRTRDKSRTTPNVYHNQCIELERCAHTALLAKRELKIKEV